MTLDDQTMPQTAQPMSLSELVRFFMTGWNLRLVLDANLVENGYPRNYAKAFILDASSSFYAQFGDAIDLHVKKWIRCK